MFVVVFAEAASPLGDLFGVGREVVAVCGDVQQVADADAVGDVLQLATLPNGPEVFVFPDRQRHTAARRQSYSGFRRRFRRALAAVGLEDVTPHDLRATHASWVADSHGVMTAARRLGHANASVTTRHYARPIDGRDAQVAKHLDKLGTKRASGTQRTRKRRKKES